MSKLTTIVIDAPARRSAIARDLHSAKYRARIIRNKKAYDRKAMRREDRRYA